METIQIGTAARKTLTSLAKMPDDAVAELAERLKEVDFRAFPATEAIRRAATVSRVERQTAIDVTKLLLSLWFTQGNTKRSIEQTTEDVVKQIAQGMDPMDLSPSELDAIRRHLKVLLDQPNLRNGQNASSLMLDHDRVFSSARILTDMRPVFDYVVPPSIGGGLVIHTLKIVYYKSDGNVDEFFVAMDENDVDLLIKQLERAKSKADTLSKLIVKTGVKHIANRSDEDQ